jgi:hypothetical protein
VTSEINPSELSEMFLTGFASLQDAAAEVLGNYEKPRILCIPYAGECIPVLTGAMSVTAATH